MCGQWPETVLRQAIIVITMNANTEERRGEYHYYEEDRAWPGPSRFDNKRIIELGHPRLDRLTSGLLMFGRNPGKAREMETQIRTRQVRKEYICRVEGEFPM